MRRLLFLSAFVFLHCFPVADFRRLRSVDSENPLLNSVEFIWSVTTVAVGDTAVLHCSFDAIFQQLRTSNIDWFKEPPSSSSSSSGGSDVISPAAAAAPTKVASGKRVTVEDRRFRVYRPHNTALSVLIIRRSKKQDAAVYRCNLSGSTTRHKYMILNVTESKIEAQTSAAKTVAKVGTDVALWCNATGYPKPVVYWVREDRNRTLPGGKQQFWGNELYFERVTEVDTGVYKCFVDNFVQPVVSYKFTIMVEDNPWYVDGSKMRFDSSHWYSLESPDPKPAMGKSYLLLCETRGSPKPLPQITWYRDGKLLRNSRHFYIINDSPEWRPTFTSSTLVIMRFLSDFHGNYTCVASNAFRMKKQTFQLTVEQNTEKSATFDPAANDTGRETRTAFVNAISGSATDDAKKRKSSEERSRARQIDDRKLQQQQQQQQQQQRTPSTVETSASKTGGKAKQPGKNRNQSTTTASPDDEDDDDDDDEEEEDLDVTGSGNGRSGGFEYGD